MSKESLVTTIESYVKDKDSLSTKDMTKLMKMTGLSFKQISAQCKLIKKRMEEEKKEKGEDFQLTKFVGDVIEEAKHNSNVETDNSASDSEVCEANEFVDKELPTE